MSTGRQDQQALSTQDRQVLALALGEGLSLAEALQRIASRASHRAAWRALWKKVFLLPCGAALFDALLRKGAPYELELAGALACRPEDIEVLLEGGAPPLRKLCASLPHPTRTYQAFYNRLRRKSPDLVRRLKDSSAPQAPSTFFEINDRELGI